MPSPFWARHADRRPFLLGRMRIAMALRRFVIERDIPAVGNASFDVRYIAFERARGNGGAAAERTRARESQRAGARLCERA